MRVAYLCSQYPYISHTFVLREVEALRALDVEIVTFSVRATAPEHLLADADRRAAATTYSILPSRPAHLMAAAARAVVTRPRRTLATLAQAIRLSPGGIRGLLWQIFYFGEALIVWDRCRRARTQHVHAHFANNAADIALLASELGGPSWRWSFTMHGPVEFADVGRHRLRQKVERAEFVVCISDYCRSQLMRLVGPDRWTKLHTVHCAVDPDRFSATPRMRAPDAPVRILTVARLTADKGVPLLVQALGELVRSGVDATLTIVGDGPEREAIGRQVRDLGLADRVVFAGFVGQDRILDEYLAADIFCLPSFAEGVPVVLMEAMATELPVVAPRIMGIPELVEHDVSGLLVTPARVDEIVVALARLAADPDERVRMGREGCRAIRSGFASNAVARDLRRLFDSSPAATPWTAEGRA